MLATALVYISIFDSIYLVSYLFVCFFFIAVPAAVAAAAAAAAAAAGVAGGAAAVYVHPSTCCSSCRGALFCEAASHY